MDDLLHLEELLRSVMQTELNGEQPIDAAAQISAIAPHIPSQERPSRMFRFRNMLRNPFRSNENDDRNDLCNCPRSHAITQGKSFFIALGVYMMFVIIACWFVKQMNEIGDSLQFDYKP